MHKVCAEKPKACFVMNRDRKQVIKHEEFFLRKVFATKIIRRRAAWHRQMTTHWLHYL